VDKIEMIKQWVSLGGISDHSPIFLEISGISPETWAPFKFNSTYLRYEDFQRIVKEVW